VTRGRWFWFESLTLWTLYAGLVPLLVLLLLLPLVMAALTPLFLIQRYRAGKARRLARPWVATLALVLVALSALFFLVGAGVTSIWVTGVLAGASAGLAAGLLLGAIGLVVTRWEATPRTLHYTPNRWLILLVTLIVSARILYGLYRSVAVAQAGVSGTSVMLAFGIPESFAAGGVVIGYYLFYNAGLRWRIQRWLHRPLRGM
jgi:hypothetical protein